MGKSESTDTVYFLCSFGTDGNFLMGASSPFLSSAVWIGASSFLRCGCHSSDSLSCFLMAVSSLSELHLPVLSGFKCPFRVAEAALGNLSLCSVCWWRLSWSWYKVSGVSSMTASEIPEARVRFGCLYSSLSSPEWVCDTIEREFQKEESHFELVLITAYG